MATDVQQVIANLLAFYDFKEKTIIAVGAGGGQLAEYGRTAGKVIALDRDAQALETLRDRLKDSGLEDKFTLIQSDFFESVLKADAVLFEFCLHEMTDPEAALKRAKTMAPDIILIDHWPGSEWAFLTAEENKVAGAWRALMRFPLKKKQKHDAVQVFQNHEELYEKVKEQGETSLSRIAGFKGQIDISIPMPYGLALI